MGGGEQARPPSLSGLPPRSLRSKDGQEALSEAPPGMRPPRPRLPTPARRTPLACPPCVCTVHAVEMGMGWGEKGAEHSWGRWGSHPVPSWWLSLQAAPDSEGVSLRPPHDSNCGNQWQLLFSEHVVYAHAPSWINHPPHPTDKPSSKARATILPILQMRRLRPGEPQ